MMEDKAGPYSSLALFSKRDRPDQRWMQPVCCVPQQVLWLWTLEKQTEVQLA